MNKDIKGFYALPNISSYQDIYLLDLSERCDRLESQVYAISKTLPDKERCVIEAYIGARNDLETETFKTALRWGKHNYK